jgi:hypothetical protein
MLIIGNAVATVPAGVLRLRDESSLGSLGREDLKERILHSRRRGIPDLVGWPGER